MKIHEKSDGSVQDRALEKIKNIFLSDHQLFSDMGFSANDVRKGYAEIVSPYNPRFTDKNGAMHRGLLVTLADTACGLAVFSAIGRFAPIATVDLRMDYADSVGYGQGLEARIHCEFVGRGAAHVHGDVVTTGGGLLSKVVARVSGIFAVNTPGKSFDENAQGQQA